MYSLNDQKYLRRTLTSIHTLDALHDLVFVRLTTSRSEQSVIPRSIVALSISLPRYEMNSIWKPFRALFLSNSAEMSDQPEPASWTTQEANETLSKCLAIPSRRRPALPSEIILQILDHPSSWICSHMYALPSEEGESAAPRPVIRVAAITGKPKIEVILSTDPLQQSQISNMRELVFKFHSKDQGWSSYISDHGTFNNTWSWFEAGVRRGRNSVRDTVRDSNEGSRYDYERHEIQRNRHAGRDPETYTIALDAEHPLLKNLQEGDVIDLLACALYPAWQNLVYTARVEIWAYDDLERSSSAN